MAEAGYFLSVWYRWKTANLCINYFPSMCLLKFTTSINMAVMVKFAGDMCNVQHICPTINGMWEGIMQLQLSDKSPSSSIAKLQWTKITPLSTSHADFSINSHGCHGRVDIANCLTNHRSVQMVNNIYDQLWRQKRHTVVSTPKPNHSILAPRQIRSLEWKFQEDPGQFAPWNFRSMKLSLAGTFAPGNESFKEISLPYSLSYHLLKSCSC